MRMISSAISAYILLTKVSYSNALCRLSKNADDIVITVALRTPMTKANKGGFKDTTLDYMLMELLKVAAKMMLTIVLKQSY